MESASKARRLGVGFVLTLLVAGCGGSDQTSSAVEPTDANSPATTNSTEELPVDTGSSGSADDACALLSTDELAVAAGGSWGEPRLVPGAETVECDYVEDDTRTKFFVAVYRDEAVAAAGGPEQLVASLAYPAGTEGTAIELGDTAAFFEFPHVQNFVVMVVNGSVVKISGETSFGMTFDQASMTAIAGIVADNF